jgi:hypothetical protein
MRLMRFLIFHSREEIPMSLDDLKTANFFHIEPDSIFYKFFLESTYPWELLDKIGDFVKAIGASLSLSDYEKVGDDVWISKEATIYEYTTIKGPTIIESGVDMQINRVRFCAPDQLQRVCDKLSCWVTIQFFRLTIAIELFRL